MKANSKLVIRSAGRCSGYNLFKKPSSFFCRNTPVAPLPVDFISWNFLCSCNLLHFASTVYLLCSKTCVKWPLSKRSKIGFQDQISLNAGRTYCRMLQGEILSTFIKLPFVIMIFVLCIFEWPFYTGFTALTSNCTSTWNFL